jgi:two-component system cell cycle sensor histidine kinase/response regulator CckA
LIAFYVRYGIDKSLLILVGCGLFMFERKWEGNIMHRENSAKILVVDDNPSILFLIDELLSANKYQTILASSGEEALEIVSKEPSIDLLLTDIDMPGINGVVLAKKFCDLYPKIKVLFMSGYMLPTDLFDILGKKVPFLKKPFDIITLIAQIKSVLG